MINNWAAFNYGKFTPISPEVDNTTTEAYTPRGWVNELRDYRNKWAHPRDYTVSDADRFLTTSFLVLTHAGLYQAASEIEELRRKYLSSEYAKEIPFLLRSRGHAKTDIAQVESLLKLTVPSIIEIRNTLHQFLKTTVRRQGGVRFEGDVENIYELAQFAREKRLMTEPERSVVASVYTLLSDSHSFVDTAFARNAVLYCIWVILRRYEGRPTSGVIPERYDATQKFWLVEEYFKGIRTGHFGGRAFEHYFDQELLRFARARLRYSDVTPLLAAIKNDKIDAEIRSNCAGLIISPRCFHAPEGRHKIEAELDDYFRSNLNELPWQVARSIGLALANRSQVPYRLLDYLDLIEGDDDLIRANLAESDRYNLGTDGAKSYYRDRLRNREIPPGACVWEAYYIAHRSREGERNSDLQLLESRLPEIETPRLREFWERMCRWVVSLSGT